MIAQGDIRWFRFGTPDKRRPVLVLGRPDILPSLSQVPVLPISTQARGLEWEVALTEADGVLAMPGLERSARDLAFLSTRSIDDHRDGK